MRTDDVLESACGAHAGGVANRLSWEITMNRRDFLLASGSAACMIGSARDGSARHASVARSEFCERLRPVGRILELDEWHVWGCSPIVDPDGRTHVFYSRWRGSFSNWLKTSEIAHAVATQPEGPYQDLGVVLQGAGPGCWDADTMHNPTIHRIGNQYALFYISSNLAEAKRRGIHPAGSQRIGLALAPSLDGPWKRVSGDRPILDIDPSAAAWDSFLTTNPAFMRHPNGECWLYYKAWDRAHDNLRKMGLAIAADIEGPYVRHAGNPIVSFAHLKREVEDSYVWFEGGRFHMLMRDMGVVDPRVGLYMESDDGVEWSAPQLGYESIDVYDAREPRTRFERPQVLLCNGKATHLFLALMGGKAGKSSGYVVRINETAD